MSGNQVNDGKEHDDDLLGFGHPEESDDNLDDNIVEEGDLKMADLDTKCFRKDLWEAPPSVPYDDRESGPANMPDGHQRFSPLQIFLLLFPLELVRVIVVQTNLYYLQSLPEVLEPLLTVKELFVFIALHMMMTSCWGGSQDFFFWVRVHLMQEDI